MSSIVVNPKKSNRITVAQLLKKLRVNSKVLSNEKIEDAALFLLLHQADRAETVAKNEVIKKLSTY